MIHLMERMSSTTIPEMGVGPKWVHVILNKCLNRNVMRPTELITEDEDIVYSIGKSYSDASNVAGMM